MILDTAKKSGIWYSAITDDKERLVACSFSKSRKAAQESAIQSLPKTLRREVVRSPRASKSVRILHDIYLGRDLRRAPRIALVTSSRFFRKTYRSAVKIPKGKVTTYGRLGKRLGSKRLARAVGNAMARNPLPLVVPCHRVVHSTLRVGKYGGAGSGGSRTKRELLVREGVRFDGERVSRRSLWWTDGVN